MEDECDIYFDIIQTRMEIFHSTFSSYNKIDLGCFINLNRDTVSMTNLENEIKLLSDLEQRIDYMIPDLQNKLESIKSILDCLNCQNHKKILHDLDILKITSNRLITVYEQKKKENEEKQKKLRNSEFYLSQGEYIYENDASREIKDQNSNEFIYIEDYYNPNSNYLTQGNISGNYEDQNEQEFSSLKYALDIEQKEFLIDNENLKQINEIKNKIKDLTRSIDKEIMKGKEVLIEIDNNVSEYGENIDKTNDELRKAALLKNRNNAIKYPLIMGTLLGAAGSFVPGIGNAIGATLGTGVGIALSRMEKKAIKKIEPDKYKD